ncbi:hypothetical protein Ahy_A09g043125 [Arachis hypogaea]|uniref:Uncharacterized protein n=1 Tax=Arachis hypogaea TaxID=3818 RepID=A0A445BHK2_ARAHY|nr:hypothetical protein Ahy_A09g043125 [Arachis hypogaea]
MPWVSEVPTRLRCLTTTILLFLLSAVGISTSLAKNSHVITFRSPNLFPEGLAWDSSGQHFLVSSLCHRTISTVSDAGVVEILISDPFLPENVTVLGPAVDSCNNRVLGVLNALKPLHPFNALTAYDLRSGQRLFLSLLSPASNGESDGSDEAIAKEVTVDFKGNAYVTNSAENFIWKVNDKEEASILSNSRRFTEHPVDREAWYSLCGLNGIAYTAPHNDDLISADAVALKSNDVVLVVSPVAGKLWFLKSNDGWGDKSSASAASPSLARRVDYSSKDLFLFVVKYLVKLVEIVDSDPEDSNNSLGTDSTMDDMDDVPQACGIRFSESVPDLRRLKFAGVAEAIRTSADLTLFRPDYDLLKLVRHLQMSLSNTGQYAKELSKGKLLRNLLPRISIQRLVGPPREKRWLARRKIPRGRLLLGILTLTSLVFFCDFLNGEFVLTIPSDLRKPAFIAY